MRERQSMWWISKKGNGEEQQSTVDLPRLSAAGAERWAISHGSVGLSVHICPSGIAALCTTTAHWAHPNSPPEVWIIWPYALQSDPPCLDSLLSVSKTAHSPGVERNMHASLLQNTRADRDTGCYGVRNNAQWSHMAGGKRQVAPGLTIRETGDLVWDRLMKITGAHVGVSYIAYFEEVDKTCGGGLPKQVPSKNRGIIRKSNTDITHRVVLWIHLWAGPFVSALNCTNSS